MTITTPATCKQCSRDHHAECSLGDDCGCVACGIIREPPSGVTWEDPPVASRGPTARAMLSSEQREALQARPKVWARLRDYAARSGAYTAAKKLRANEPGFEFRGALPGPTGSALYARYVG